jgi:large subunit ribosomal protein L11
MAKKVKAKLKMQIQGGVVNPGMVGAILGQHQVNMMEFCKQFNARTADKKGEVVPVLMTVYEDKTFEFVTKTPPTTALLKKASKISKGSARPHDTKVATVSWQDIENIAKIKMQDLNASDLEQAKKIIAGSARSMGIDVLGEQ